MAESLGVKVDDYNYWAKGHLEEYVLRIDDNNQMEDDPMRLDIDDIKKRISVFNDIIEALGTGFHALGPDFGINLLIYQYAIVLCSNPYFI